MAADLAASWRPELRDGADGVIDRSQDARHSAGPNGGSTPRTCLELASRNPSWQRSCVTASTDRTYDRKRSDPHAASPLASRGPSTYGVPDGSLTRSVRDDSRWEESRLPRCFLFAGDVAGNKSQFPVVSVHALVIAPVLPL